MEQATKYKVQDKATGAFFNCSPNQSLLVAMERTNPGLIKVGCRGGGCGVCKIKVLKGEYIAKAMSRKQVSLEEQAQGYVLACRSYPRTNLVFEVAVSEEHEAKVY